MARGKKKTPSRREKRKEAEAADAIAKAESDGKASRAGKTKKKAAKTKKKKKRSTKSRRTKTKPAQRKRLIWAIFSGGMKEEARFPYAERKEAEKKLEQLRSKTTKKQYFIQPIKEPIPEAPAEAEED